MRYTQAVATIAVLAFAGLGGPASAGAGPERVVRENAAPGSAFELDGVSGTVTVIGAGDRTLTVDAAVTTNGAPAAARDHVRVERAPGRITVCTVRRDQNACGGDHHGGDSDDTRVDYQIGLPEGVSLAVRNVDGAVAVRGVRSTIDVNTVNGDLSLDGDRSIAAKTVNGKIDATARATRGAPCSFQTLDGSVSLRLRRSSDATVTARTLNGSIAGEGRIALADRSRSFVGHDATGTVGSGSGSVSIQTLNGSVRVVAE